MALEPEKHRYTQEELATFMEEEDVTESQKIEQFDHAVEQLRVAIGELAEKGEEQTRAADEAAEANVARFHEASEELARERQRLADLEEERERLPFEAYRAHLDGDAKLEKQLKERYENIGPQDLEALRQRCAELEAEKASLAGPHPRVPGGTEFDAKNVAYAEARDAYSSVLASLQSCSKELKKLEAGLQKARDKLWNGQRRWEEELRLQRELIRVDRRTGLPVGS